MGILEKLYNKINIIEIYIRWIILVTLRDIIRFPKVTWEEDGRVTAHLVNGDEEPLLIFYKSNKYNLHRVWAPWKYWLIYMIITWFIIKYEFGQMTFEQFEEYMTEPLEDENES